MLIALSILNWNFALNAKRRSKLQNVRRNFMYTIQIKSPWRGVFDETSSIPLTPHTPEENGAWLLQILHSTCEICN